MPRSTLLSLIPALVPTLVWPGLAAANAPASLTLVAQGQSCVISLTDLQTRVVPKHGAPRLVSQGVAGGPWTVEASSPDTATLRNPAQGLQVRFECRADGLEMAFTATKAVDLAWPVVPLTEAKELIWPLADGRLVPTSDRVWMKDLQEAHTLGSGLPLWGYLNGQGTMGWATETPYRLDLAVSASELGLRQTFLCRRGTETHHLSFRYSEKQAPLLPAFLLRERLLATGRFTTLKEKLAGLPAGDRLLGSLQAYTWGTSRVSVQDVRPGRWKALAEGITKRASEGSALGTALAASLDAESRSALAEIVRTGWAAAYAKAEVVRVLDAVLARIPAQALHGAFPDCFLPPATWGEGVSPAFIQSLQSLGIDRARVTCPDPDDAPLLGATAEAAKRAGYLFGIYDSYHSIHPRSIWNTDQSWASAQFPGDLYHEGAIQKKDGTFYAGFKGVGRILDPVAAWPQVQNRVAAYLAKAPLNAYFVDCDAAGEIHENYHAAHPTTSEEAADARLKRLRWLAKDKGLVVGSEGGDALIAAGIAVSEGLFGPTFYWEDPAYKDKQSPHYKGAYWPPSAPTAFFKAHPLKADSLRRYFDPATRIPLFAAAFHDSVVMTNHWEADLFKFADLERQQELFQMLNLAAPMCNLNRDRLAQRGKDILRNYTFFSPIHRAYGAARLLDFQWLTPDRRVQLTRYEGGLEMIVNFSDKDVVHQGRKIAAKSALACFQDGTTSILPPTRGR